MQISFEQYKLSLEKTTKLKHNKDFMLNIVPKSKPSDKVNTLNNINKIVSIDTDRKEILSKVFKIYNLVSKKIIFQNIKCGDCKSN